SVYRMTAVNFRLSAEALHPSLELRDDGSPAKLTAIPFYFLVSQAIELFLKSALLKRGYVPADLRRFDNKHNLRALLELLKKKGLPVSGEAASIIEGLSPQHAPYASLSFSDQSIHAAADRTPDIRRASGDSSL